jgi:hypothetical protein
MRMRFASPIEGAEVSQFNAWVGYMWVQRAKTNKVRVGL